MHARTQIQVPMRVQQALYWLSPLPSLLEHFLCAVKTNIFILDSKLYSELFVTLFKDMNLNEIYIKIVNYTVVDLTRKKYLVRIAYVYFEYSSL